MERDLKVIEDIQREKERDIDRAGQPPLDPEGRRLAEEKRFTFDVIAVPTDPLR